MDVPSREEVFRSTYRTVLDDDTLNESEKAGYLLAASRIDPRLPELTIDEARRLVRNEQP